MTTEKWPDKSEWGPGPWQDEPDRLEWDAHGHSCLMVRNRTGGNWCGYVAMPPAHPWHGKDYNDISGDIDVHGGITYADKCQGSICHVPKPGEPDNVWWLGFDCAHSDDERPGDNAYWRSKGRHDFATGFGRYSSYKTLEYVKRETEKLAKQAAEAK